tara:strand:- start:1 stop:120 length:120 start_codon:yes stop_codon:yes gene_type:complete
MITALTVAALGFAAAAFTIFFLRHFIFPPKQMNGGASGI